MRCAPSSNGAGIAVVAVDDGQWVEVGRAVGEAVASGRCADTGVLFCWTGTWSVDRLREQGAGRALRLHRRHHCGRSKHLETTPTCW